MNPQPIIPIALVIACGVTAVLSLSCGNTGGRAMVIGAVATPLVSFCVALLILAAIMLLTGDSPAWTLRTVAFPGTILGLETAVLALPCGLLVAQVVKWIRPGWIRPGWTLSKALATVLICTMLFAALGCGIGCALGTWVPSYYRDLYPGGHTEPFNPVTMGIGLGLTQGIAGGAVVGVALVAILAWYDVRRYEKRSDGVP